MASNVEDEDASPTQNTEKAPRTSSKRKRPTRFSARHDIALLTEVLTVNPFVGPLRGNKWDAIAERLRPLFQVDGRRCKDRVGLIVKYFIAQDNGNLRKSGTEEEYDQRDQMLHEVCDMKQDAEEQEAAATFQISQWRQSEDWQGSMLMNNSVVNCPTVLASTEEEQTPPLPPRPSSKSSSNSLHSTSRQPAVMEASMRLGRPETPSPCDSQVETQWDSDDVIDPITAAETSCNPRVARSWESSISTIITFLQGRDAQKKEFQLQKLALRSRELDLEDERLRLQRDRIDIEKTRAESERKRVELDSKMAERNQELLRAILDNQRMLMDLVKLKVKNHS